MFQMHPHEIHDHVQLRQEIVQEGIVAARHPGDLAGLREMIGRSLIAVGERIQGRQGAARTVAPIPGCVMQLAR